MPTGADADRAEWVRRVLGASLARTDGSRSEGRGAAVRLAQARLGWYAAREQAASGLDRVRDAILRDVAGLSVAGEVADNVGRLHAVFDELDTRLIDTLDAALGAEPAARPALLREAARLTAAHLAFLERDPILREVDDNPFVAVAVAAPLRDALRALAAELG